MRKHQRVVAACPNMRCPIVFGCASTSSSVEGGVDVVGMYSSTAIVSCMALDEGLESEPPATHAVVWEPIMTPPSPKATRSLRRTTTSDGSPSRVRHTIPRHASTSAIVPVTPTAKIAQLMLATRHPSPPYLLLPIHARARALLRATCNSPSTEMAGRDAEHVAISAFFASLSDHADAVEHTSLYISGTPGTGKTALINSTPSVSARSRSSLSIVWP
ncbi:hypothetical protein B0H11DRAFT_2141381 [Mycena galericulata]|nr:hypothetical protein B0H11DRAFT_2141381 [Mycena galericulata]